MKGEGLRIGSLLRLGLGILSKSESHFFSFALSFNKCVGHGSIARDLAEPFGFLLQNV